MMNMNYIYILLTVLSTIYFIYQISKNSNKNKNYIKMNEQNNYSIYTDYFNNVFVGIDDQKKLLNNANYTNIYITKFRK